MPITTRSTSSCEEEQGLGRRSSSPSACAAPGPTFDLVDAKTGEVIAEAGKKVTPRAVKKLIDEGQGHRTSGALRADRRPLRRQGHHQRGNRRDLCRGRRRADLGIDKDGEVTGGTLKELIDAGITEIPVLDIDNITVGPYMRNTMASDKNMNRDTALMDIYRVMRPGEPPTVEAASTLFDTLFFDSERYDLSAVGRVKMNMRLDARRRGHAAHAAQGRHRRLHQGAGRTARRQWRHRRHRPPRQPPGALGRRADGEPVPRRPPADGARDQGAHVVGRDRHGDAAGPDQRQARRGRGARVLRLLAAVAVHGPDQPAVGSHAQAAPLGAGPGRPDPRARGLRGARRAPDPLRPDVPDRDAGRPEYRPDQLARHLRAGEQVRLHRNALPQGEGRAGDR
jgi:hypothetical protein